MPARLKRYPSKPICEKALRAERLSRVKGGPLLPGRDLHLIDPHRKVLLVVVAVELYRGI